MRCRGHPQPDVPDHADHVRQGLQTCFQHGVGLGVVGRRDDLDSHRDAVHATLTVEPVLVARYSAGMAAPDMAAARRAADELVTAGAGRVLLFGSVARGEATERSDIDLVAIYDDLDYSVRSKRRCALEARASDAAGCSVDVMVTDAPEWAIRTTRVPCSVETRIAGYAVEVADVGSHDRINWDKEIGLPADPTAELETRFEDMSDAIAALTNQLRPSADEIAAVEDGDDAERFSLEDVRWARAMGEVHMIVESAAKALHIVSVGTAPPHDHRIPRLLAQQPESVRSAFTMLVGTDVDLTEMHIWRPAATYAAGRPQARFGEDSLRTHANVALHIAEIAADRCRRQGISAPALASYDRRRDRCGVTLDGPIRHRDGRGLSF